MPRNFGKRPRKSQPRKPSFNEAAADAAEFLGAAAEESFAASLLQ